MLTTFFLANHSALIAFAARRTNNGYQAEDAVSETYLRLLEKWESFEDLNELTDLLKLAKVILRNVICDDFRRLAKAKKFAESEGMSLTADDEKADCVNEASSLMKRILKMADFTKKELEVLPFVIEGYPNREIAKVLGVASEEVSKPRSTLIRRLRKVVQRNRNLLDVYENIE